ncbi:transhydrogenase [Toxoplasma gondii VEG]|uniref:proton-translocating NAD(P)(+) transhydrogenase n=1 Tax=Toxoplasma gondii (strain ATCC 50861 / VEG) TaxID=432359 RepID=V4YN61_TOXGV|nr:transhydrogenase [Toxoplasma gondii VEG]
MRGFVYLFSAICFILSLRGLSTPETAKRGNILGMTGMGAAILITFSTEGFGGHYAAFFLTIAPPAIVGVYIAQSVSMVQMPQLVALFHSFVGLAAVLVGISSFHAGLGESGTNATRAVETAVGEFVAAVTFTGSLVAAAKLHELMDPKSLKIPGRHAINAMTVAAVAVVGITFCATADTTTKIICLYTLITLSLWLGFHLVASIGGADMPVVISMLNSYSGFATAASGFMLDNNLLIIAGSLIGSSGAILSYIMCRGMNRDLWSVVLGGWEDAPAEGVPGVEGVVREISPDSVAEEVLLAKKVLIVPGYGMAVSRCQSDVADIAQILASRGVEVEFGIHPVAGRMPGHMNVLLAEANVSYRSVKEMSEVNKQMLEYDVVIVVGANDTVNPASLEPGTKIYGMPVIEVWKAKRVIVLKRSLAPGYAAIDNPLFFLDNTRMLFGNAKDTTTAIFACLSQRAAFVGKSAVFLDLEGGARALEEGRRETPPTTWPSPKRTVGVLKDSNGRGTPLVSLAPRFVKRLRKQAFRVIVESGAGAEANFSDDDYVKAGAEIMPNADTVISRSDVILKVSVPSEELIRRIPRGKILISHVFPGQNAPLLELMASQGLTALAVDEVPRITRAQNVDVKSSMQGLQGYRAVLEAFNALPRLSKTSITAAGRVDAARVLVLGAGVAGLQAISTAHGLQAEVFAYDVRAATREEVESCGGTFLSVELEEEGEVEGGYAREMGEAYEMAQKQMLSRVVPNVDVIICTAAIHGKPSPKLISNDMLATMRPGSVVIDLATEFGDRRSNWGGNVEGSPTDGETQIHGVTIIGRSRIETQMPTQASELFSMNMSNLLEELGGGENFRIDLTNEVIKGLCCVHEGRVSWAPPEPLPRRPPTPSPRSSPRLVPPKEVSLLDQLVTSDAFFAMSLVCTAAFAGLLGVTLKALELQQFTLLALSLIVGYYSVWSVTPALHTPLMSVTNALSGVIIIGSMLEYGPSATSASAICALCATSFSSLNIAGGFYVTQRMMQMFQIA